MTRVLGGIGTSHVPAIGRAIAQGLETDGAWKPFFDSYAPVRRWLTQAQPDVAVVFYNDHGLNFFLDKMPTFAVGAAPQYANADEGWGLPVADPVPGDSDLSWRIIEGLVGRDFDVTSCQEMLVDHALTIPLKLLWPDAARAKVRVVPIAINTVQHPLPSPRRCLALGQAVRAALNEAARGARVVVVGSGGLSHQLDGARAGFLNPAFDRRCLADLVTAPERLAAYSNADLIAEAGTQGVELLTWLAMRGALQAPRGLHAAYHAPISNTGAAVLLMQDEAFAPPAERAA